MKIKKKAVEMLFNENKYRGIKNLFSIIMVIIISIILSDNKQIYIVFFVPLLTIFLIMDIIKIMWYNKKNNFKTRVIDKIAPFLYILVIIACFYLV